MTAAILFDDRAQIAILAVLATLYLTPAWLILRARQAPVAARAGWTATALLTPPAAYLLVTLALFDLMFPPFASILAEFQASLLLLLLASCAPWLILARFRRRHPPGRP
jgi:hypothetical protein